MIIFELYAFWLSISTLYQRATTASYAELLSAGNFKRFTRFQARQALDLGLYVTVTYDKDDEGRKQPPLRWANVERLIAEQLITK
ncbi:hypothetical protein EVAR_66502_1 [Eumeta japonica]|uniref:Uncharacterized protein n=1 Tax=Eumeta variegata TaxID=151549 RepID=A0A4C1Z9E8_EUMVA|nr:hypothetical protein EVAR_66502_1 [Eumeta japonica]